MDVKTLKNFVSRQERDHLEAKAYEYRDAGILEANPRGESRWFKKINGTDLCDEIMQKVGDRVIEAFELKGYQIDPYLGWIVSFIEPGGFINRHRDYYEFYQDKKHRHLRCNVMVSKNSEMANPNIGNMTVPIEERGLWAFFASEQQHGTRTMANDKLRIVFQYGFAVPAAYRLETLLPWPRLALR